jgi:signal transduction histidine kinase
MTRAGTALLDLIRAALAPERRSTIDDLVAIVAATTGSSGAVLWEAPDELCGDPTLSVLAVGSAGGGAVGREPVAADTVTARAHRRRSLALPSDEPGGAAQIFGRPVAGALPIEYADGGTGVLTLLGEDELGPVAYDIAVDLLGVLPELCSAVRERQTLDLANACNTILHDADVESPDRPLTRKRLGEHLSEVCDTVSAVLACPDVSIFVQDPAVPDDGYRWLAGTGRVDLGRLAAEPAEVLESGVGPRGRPLMEVRLISGERVNGLLRCAGSSGPPHHFTASDIAVVRLVAAQLSRYWRGWLRRRADGVENETWRGLADGMTSFNQVLAEKLRAAPAEAGLAEHLNEMALTILRDIVPGATGARVALTDRIPTAAPDRGPGWHLQTPIAVGDRLYGVLEGDGLGAEPANSAQVYKIIADQIGLHRHLHDTLTALHRAKRDLEAAVRSEAEAMEDLKHQLVSPLRTAANRTEKVLSSQRFDHRAELQLKAIRGLCRKASRVAMSAGVFSALSKGERPVPRLETYGSEDVLKLLIAAAADAEVLGDPSRKIAFEVDRASVGVLHRRLVAVDSSFLQQCIGNVLDNAAKYSYDDTRVLIELVARRPGVAVAVTSTGIPMSAADIAHCRDRNWRGDDARYTTGEGAGLGLWIVDHLMRAVHGRLDITAVADRTTVRLGLPVSRP